VAWTAEDRQTLRKGSAAIVIFDMVEEEFRKKIIEGRESAVVLFHMPRCPYCVEFTPKFQELSKNMKVMAVQVDISDYNTDLWEEYRIEAVPTVIAFKEGQVCARADAILHVGLSIGRLKEEMQKRPECF